MIPGKCFTRAVSTAPLADINSILSSSNWLPMLTNSTVDAATRQFIGTNHTVLTHTIGPLAPPQQVRVQRKSKLTTWVDHSLLASIKKKRDSYSLYRKYPTDLNYSLYKIQRNMVRQLSGKAHRTYIRAIKDTLTSPNRRRSIHLSEG